MATRFHSSGSLIEDELRHWGTVGIIPTMALFPVQSRDRGWEGRKIEGFG